MRRDLLDALAVMMSRYHWSIHEVVPLIITDELPNRRSEYWEIVKDIREVTGVRIATVTILACHLLLWNCTKLLPSSYFMSIRTAVPTANLFLEKSSDTPS